MALYCLISAGGSPGVTTTALALALTWPGEVMLAECDPAGRRVLPGFLAERLTEPPGPGLLGLAMALDRHRTDAEAGTRVEDFTIPLTEADRTWLLHGIRDPRHARHVDWPLITNAFIQSGRDVIADLGRVGGPDTPTPLLRQAEVVVLVVGRSLPQVDAAQPRLEALQAITGGRTQIGLCLIDSGRYSSAEISKALSGLPVLAELPHAPADAHMLSDGGPQRLTFRTCLLMRAATRLGDAMRRTAQPPPPLPGDVQVHPATATGGGR
jgi:hypothetical protein